VIGQHDYRRAAALRTEMRAIGWLTATVVGSAILMWNRSFLELWVGPGHYAGSWSNLLLVLMMVQTVFIRTDAYVINTTLRLRERVLISLPAAALTCGLAVLLVPRFGISGMCLSVLGGRLTQSIAYPMVVNASLGRIRRVQLPAARPAVVMLLLFAMSTSFGQQVVFATWITWALGVVVSVGVLLAVALLLGMDHEIRRPLLVRARSVALPAGWGA
jgi:O-antigen/teichoic acid export membrane protein